MSMQSKMADWSNLKFSHEGAMKFKESVVFLSWSVATLAGVLAVWCWCRLRDFSSSSKIKTQYTLYYPTF
jgi:NO-binding membrane sensor protein with MHYT domain